MKKLRKDNGITLIALVVTIVVLLILAGITISTLFGENGVINAARRAEEDTKKDQVNTEKGIKNLESEINDILKIPIDKTVSYVGYYADVNADGIVDGIIYADLAVGGSGQWINEDGKYVYEAITGTKDYYIKQKDYDGPFGIKDVLSSFGTGNDRFYVMALSNKGGENFYYWYNPGYYGNELPDLVAETSTDFGTGKANTNILIEKWNNGGYESTHAEEGDLWGSLKEEFENGWFVPSKSEWAAFADSLGINFWGNGISAMYWSSSQTSKAGAWIANFYYGQFSYDFGSIINGRR